MTTLAQMIPEPQFREEHHIDIAAEMPVVWDALARTAWNDLRLTKAFMRVRSFGTRALTTPEPLLENGPVRTMVRNAPSYAAGARIAQPWRARPTLRDDIATAEQIAAFTEPGWLKMGMDFTLEPHDGGTRITTRTRCQATDLAAQRRFRNYWRLIRPFSGLIRRDMLAAIRRNALAGTR